VTLSIEPWCNIEKLYEKLNSNDNIHNKDGNRIIMSIPNSPNLPDWLDNLENCKSEFGISGLSVSLITLEQVFLK
jgi:ATP-binding cassette subfamily A (ABC1) protein 3